MVRAVQAALARSSRRSPPNMPIKGVLLVKINVDENRFIASQFRVQSIPTVYAIFQGQPVADLTSARTESQYRQMLDQLLASCPIESEAGAAGAGHRAADRHGRGSARRGRRRARAAASSRRSPRWRRTMPRRIGGLHPRARRAGPARRGRGAARQACPPRSPRTRRSSAAARRSRLPAPRRRASMTGPLEARDRRQSRRS